MNAKSAAELFEMSIAHIGINAKGDKEAVKFAEQFFKFMGLPIKETPISYFNDQLIEIMKENGRGTNGHIGFKVNDCEKAIKYFVTNGLKVAQDTIKYDEEGKCIFAYFEQEIAGFAIHLIQR